MKQIFLLTLFAVLLGCNAPYYTHVSTRVDDDIITFIWDNVSTTQIRCSADNESTLYEMLSKSWDPIKTVFEDEQGIINYTEVTNTTKEQGFALIDDMYMLIVSVDNAQVEIFKFAITDRYLINNTLGNLGLVPDSVYIDRIIKSYKSHEFIGLTTLKHELYYYNDSYSHIY